MDTMAEETPGADSIAVQHERADSVVPGVPGNDLVS